MAAAIKEGTFVVSNPRLISIPNQVFGQINANRIPDKITTQINTNKAENIAVTYFIDNSSQKLGMTDSNEMVFLHFLIRWSFFGQLTNELNEKNPDNRNYYTQQSRDEKRYKK